MNFCVGYFQRAILSSGTATSPWYSENTTLVASKELIRIMGCYNDYVSPQVILCLRSKSTEEILSAYKKLGDVRNQLNTDILLS